MELEEGDLYNQAQPPTPLPTTLPQYPEIILAAIEALGKKKGSNKSSISRHIEASYGSLSPVLLSHHLNKMKSSGQLHFLNNNYFLPDPNSSPRRGRGRPPKPKTSLRPPPGSVLLPPRPRGRPPKSPSLKTTITAPAPAPALSGKKRGRPPKAGDAAPPPPAAGGVRRGRGRPPKVKSPVTAPLGA